MCVNDKERKAQKRQLSEEGRQFDVTTAENQRQFDTSLAETQRQFNESQNLRNAAIDRGGSDSKRGEQQILDSTGEQLPEISALQQLIRDRSLPEQNLADQRTALALRESGVRGPAAALERTRAANKMSGDLEQMIAQYALQDAQQRRGIRSDYFGNKALAGQQATY